MPPTKQRSREFCLCGHEECTVDREFSTSLWIFFAKTRCPTTELECDCDSFETCRRKAIARSICETFEFMNNKHQTASAQNYTSLRVLKWFFFSKFYPVDNKNRIYVLCQFWGRTIWTGNAIRTSSYTMRSIAENCHSWRIMHTYYFLVTAWFSYYLMNIWLKESFWPNKFAVCSTQTRLLGREWIFFRRCLFRV